VFVPDNHAIQRFMPGVAYDFATPEPGTVALFLGGLMALAVRRYRR
jgi:hypothetical protein